MAEYQLYCFAQSGNCYRAALMLNAIGADWEPVYVDFFKAGVQGHRDYAIDVCREWPTRLAPAEEFGFDIAAQHKNIGTWLDRMKALPGWAHPYDLMPGHPL
jgi:glutathione S-transferase